MSDAASNWQAAAAAFDAGGGLLTSAFNVHEMRQNRRFQAQMANTAHQREMADLKAAGLNPILTATGGNGAPVPSGGAPQVDHQDYVSKALSASQAALMSAQTKKTLAEADSAQTQAWLNDQTRWFNYRQAEANSALASNSVFKSDVETDSPVLRAYRQSLIDGYSQMHSAAEAARLSLPEARASAALYASPLGKYVPFLDKALGSASHAAGIMSKMK